MGRGPDELFKRLSSHGDASLSQSAKFEQQCLLKLLAFVRYPAPTSVLVNEHESQFGHKLLTFSWFNSSDRFAFPFTLGSLEVVVSGKLTVSQFLGGAVRKFGLLLKYDALQRESGYDDFAMLFRVRKARGASVQVIHNQVSQIHFEDFGSDTQAEDAACRRLVFRVRNRTYVWESLKSFMYTAGSSWVR